MEGFSSNLNDTFTSTRGCAEPMFFPQHILPLLPLYNAQWWGYESLTAIALVRTVYIYFYFQISDYNMLPDVAKISDNLKTCLQESDDIPRDITTLFDNSLFKLDTSLVPKAIK